MNRDRRLRIKLQKLLGPVVDESPRTVKLEDFSTSRDRIQAGDSAWNLDSQDIVAVSNYQSMSITRMFDGCDFRYVT